MWILQDTVRGRIINNGLMRWIVSPSCIEFPFSSFKTSEKDELKGSVFYLHKFSHIVDQTIITHPKMDDHHHHDDDGHGHGMMGAGGEGVALYKLEAIAITLIIALAGGLLPTRRQLSPSLLSLGNCFSGGIFISAAFLHMLQESVEGFSTLPLKTHFPLAMFCTVLGILIPFFIEKVALGGNHDHAALLNQDKGGKDGGLGVYVLWLMLGVHSIIEGICSFTICYFSIVKILF